MDRFFNMDNKFFTFMSRVADLIILNLLCIVCCIPVVTIGPSIAAMFYVTLKMVRNEESYIVRGFFKSFKQNLKQGIVINLIMLAAALLLYFDISICRSTPGTIGKVLMVLFMMILVVYLMIFLYIYPVLAKFYNTIKNTFTNAFLMSIRHLPYTLLMAVITLIPLAVFFVPNVRAQSLLFMVLILFGISLEAFINGHFLVKIFDNYITEDTDSENTDSLDTFSSVESATTPGENISTESVTATTENSTTDANKTLTTGDTHTV